MQEHCIVNVDGCGRCFQAAKDYRNGDIVLSEEPYEGVLYDDSAAYRCHHIFEETQQLQR